MAAKRKSSSKKTVTPIEEGIAPVVEEKIEEKVEETPVVEEAPVIEEAPVEEKAEETPVIEEKKEEKPKKSTKTAKKIEEKAPKYPVGSIVYVAKDASVDLNGFKLFPQYKKYTYTVEAYDGVRGVYTLRRLNLSLRLKEDLIIAPNERAHDSINRRQF